MRLRTSLLPLTIAVVLLATSACSSSSNQGGSKVPGTVNFIDPAAAGGGLDTDIRLIQPFIQKHLGSKVIVQNVAGGDTVVGTKQVLAKGTDCSQILAVQVPNLNFASYLPGAGFKTSDFAPMAQWIADVGALVVNSSSKYQTFQDLLNAAKASPGTVTVSVSDSTSYSAINIEYLEQVTGLKFKIVPFNGGGPAKTALLGGKVDAYGDSIFDAYSLGSKVRVLAIESSTNPQPTLNNNAPTMSKVVGKTIPYMTLSYGMLASQKCEKAHPGVVKKITDAILAATKDPGYLAKLKGLGTLGRMQALDTAGFTSVVNHAQQVATEFEKK